MALRDEILTALAEVQEKVNTKVDLNKEDMKLLLLSSLLEEEVSDEQHQ